MATPIPPAGSTVSKVGDVGTQGPTADTPTYKVAHGDTLSDIAKAHGISLKALVAANPDRFDARLLSKPFAQQAKHPDFIREGETINLPPPRRPAATPAPAPSAPPARDEVVGKPPVAPSSLPNTTTPKLATPEPTGVRPAADAKPEAKPDAKTAAAPKTEETSKKVFGFLDKIFKNPIFQGVIAVLAAIPGIGQVVSGLAAVLSLVNIIERFISTGKPPDLASIGSTLLFLGGIFVPGLGAFGGLMGMMRPPSEGDEGTPAASKPAAPPTKPATAPTEPMADAAYAEAMAVARKGLENLPAQSSVEAFGKDLMALQGEHGRLSARAANKSTPLSPAEQQRLADLRTYFERELPQAVFAEASRLAYGLKADSLEPTPQATAGRYYVVPAGGTLATLGAVGGLSPAPANLAESIRAYNGLGATEEVQPGQTLYLPTAEQIQKAPKPGVAGSLRLTGTESAALRDWLVGLGDFVVAPPADADDKAKRLNAMAARLEAILGNMAPPLAVMSSERGSGDVAPAPGDHAATA